MPIQQNNPPPQAPPASGDQIDTGTGGFPIDGNVTTYDVGSNVGDGNKVPWSPGQVNVDVSNKDLSKGTKRTLASYLSKTTMGATRSSPTSIGNSYSVDQNPAEDPVTISLTENNGSPTLPGKSANSNKYIDDGILSSRSTAATNLDLIRGRESSNVIFYDDKFGHRVPYNGNYLLKNATGEIEKSEPLNPSAVGGELPKIKSAEIQSTSPIKKYYGDTSNISKSVIFNRFNPDVNYENNGTRLTSAQFAKKYPLGNSLPPESPERTISYGRLAQIGNSLTQRAGIELNSSEPLNNPSDSTSQAASLLPGLGQLGVEKINRDQLTAESVLRDLTEASVDDSLLIDPAALSWGSLNNPQDQFAGISNFGMQLLAAALLVALSVVIAAFTGLFKITPTPRLKAVDDKGRRPYGAFREDPTRANYDSVAGILSSLSSFNLWRLLGISPTVNPTEQCLPVGALAFFGVKNPDATSSSFGALAGLPSTLLSVSQSPGYYSVMGRNVSRSFLIISDSFSSLVKAFNSGITAGITQSFGIIETLKNSKFIRTMDILTQIGDRIVTESQKDPAFSYDSSVSGLQVRHMSDLDNAPNNYAGKGRLNLYGNNLKISPLTQAMAAYRSPDLMIMPRSLSLTLKNSQKDFLTKNEITGFFPSVEKNYDTQRDMGGLVTIDGKYYRVTDEGRINETERIKIEDHLETEYVPFYMIDVRTNELLSFHAFLASLTDDYTANYDSVDAFGRVEPVKIYKSTNRKISFSFYIVSTNSKDFDSMWIKLNKLTTLVYPQFSKGRTLITPDGNNSIHAPFSQAIQAAPLIRLRIGDVIKSNYSKFNLARLFGYLSEDTKFSNKPIGRITESNVPAEITSAAEEAAFTDAAFLPGNTFYARSGCKFNQPKLDASTLTSLTSLYKKSIEIDPELTTDFVLGNGLVLELTDYDQKNRIVTCKVADAKPGDYPGEVKAYIQEIFKTDIISPRQNVYGKNFQFLADDLIPTDSTKKSVKSKKIQEYIEIENSKPIVEKLNEYSTEAFKFTENTAVSRSFKSSGGRGLAGFIDSMNFDWIEQTTWTTSEKDIPDSRGRRAPKMCKVTISFTPIHDITPGLDHMGSNRAPIYPIKLLND